MQAWGLLQVLQGMTETVPGRPALDEFGTCRGPGADPPRAELSPRRNEARWLPGWRQRLQTYREDPRIPEGLGGAPLPGANCYN